MAHWKILIAFAPILVAATAPWQQQALASAAPAIDRANDEWTRAIVSGNADMLAAPYSDHGIFIGPDGSVSIGKAAVRQMYAKPHAAKVLAATIKSDGRAAADADDVYEWGTATINIERDHKFAKSSGKYLTVWHREGARWLITRNIAF